MSMVLATLEAHSGCDRWHCEGNGQAESGRSSYLATHPCRHCVMVSWRGLLCGQCGRSVGDVWCDSPPCWWYHDPSRSEIDLGFRGSAASVVASRSF